MGELNPGTSHNPIANDLQAARKFADSILHGHELGIEVEAIAQGWAQFIPPYHPRLIGNTDTGTLHGGAITTLIDTASRCAVFSALSDLIPIATLDLRINYLKPATLHKLLRADARCCRLTCNVGFTRAFAYHDDPQDPVANSVATFMVGSSNAVLGIDDPAVEPTS